MSGSYRDELEGLRDRRAVLIPHVEQRREPPAAGADGRDWAVALRHRAEAFAEDVRRATPSS